MKRMGSILRTNDKKVLEAWMNMEMITSGRGKSMNVMDKQNPLEDNWRASFSEQHQKLIRHLGGPMK